MILYYAQYEHKGDTARGFYIIAENAYEASQLAFEFQKPVEEFSIRPQGEIIVPKDYNDVHRGFGRFVFVDHSRD